MAANVTNLQNNEIAQQEQINAQNAAQQNQEILGESVSASALASEVEVVNVQENIIDKALDQLK
ncbi:MAG: hypothetical protein HRT47_13035 [Candidatus Caenarcaniphilales bacterium]|nr:hypothetical protein [Candidatus Caenarcaniphilales bacterium]